MFRFAKNAAAVIALSGLVLSQPAMAVRSSESLPAPGAKISSQVGRIGTPIGHAEHAAGVPAIGVVLGLLAASGLILLVVHGNNNHNRSPG